MSLKVTKIRRHHGAVDRKRWDPKKWWPWYEEVVALSCVGISNIELAARFKVTPVHISNIINSPTAQAVRQTILDAQRKIVKDTFEGRLTDIAHKTIERLHTVLHDDDMFKSAPLSTIDRGLKVISGLGHLKQDTSVTHIEKQIIIPSAVAERLLAGIKLSEAAEATAVDVTDR